MKDKMLMKLERDRMAGRLEGVETQLRTLEDVADGTVELKEAVTDPPTKKKASKAKKSQGQQKPIKKTTSAGTTRVTSKTHAKDSALPPDDRYR